MDGRGGRGGRDGEQVTRKRGGLLPSFRAVILVLINRLVGDESWHMAALGLDNLLPSQDINIFIYRLFASSKAVALTTKAKIEYSTTHVPGSCFALPCSFICPLPSYPLHPLFYS